MKNIIIGLIVLGSFSAIAGEVYTSVGHSWSTGGVVIDENGNFQRSYNKALSKAMKKCEMVHTDCKIVGQDQKRYRGYGGEAGEVTAITVYGSKKKININL
jgi:hypothetical protein